MESKATYDIVRTTEDLAEAFSTTEVDESVIGDEKQWQSFERKERWQMKRNIFFCVLKSYHSLIDSILLLVIVALLVLLLQRDVGAEHSSRSIQVGGDFTGAGPTFEMEVVKFEADMSFAPRNPSEFFAKETLDKWNSLMPAGTGYSSPDEIFFTTSMTHQLHCLFMMTRIYSGVTANITHVLPGDYHHHFLHCIDYLRQAVMCTADLALETHDETDSDDLGPLDGGWSGHHVCKNYHQVKDYLEEQIADGLRVVLPIDD